MATTTTEHQHLKLVIDPYERRVVFAEATGEAIEHSILTSPHVSLPFDSATRNACIGNLYNSFDKLRAFAATQNISRGPPPSAVQRQREEERFFVCGGHGNGGASSCGGYITAMSGARCPSCGGEMAVEVPRGCPGASCSDAYAELGVNGGDLSCMLKDDLSVMPAGGILSMASNLMMSFFVAPGSLQKKMVCVGFTEVRTNCGSGK